MLRIRGASRLQWVGIDNAPRTFLALAESPFNLAGKRLGAGLWVRQERLGLYDDLSLALQVSYKIRLAGGTLSIGVQPGVITEKFRGSEVFIPDDDNYHEETDEAIPRSDMSGTAFDLARACTTPAGDSTPRCRARTSRSPRSASRARHPRRPRR